MPAIFSKNCVLSGEVDCYCLVCCKHLPAEHDVVAHIQDSKHKHNLSAHPYLDKFQEDRIRKVSGVYLCEVCDTTLPTAAKVRLHVTEHTHLERKRGRMLTRTRKCIVFHENIVITENAWNGLIDDTCVLCNVEFQHDSTHTAEQSHVLNLIKSRVTITDNYDIYRQVDDTFQCLTCNKVVSIITEHLDSAQHKNSFTKYDPENDEENNDGANKTADKEYTQVNGDVTNNSIDKNYKIKSNTDLKSKSVDGTTLYTRPVLMKKKNEPVSTTTVPKHVERFAKQHGLFVIENNTEVYCDTCDTSVTATIDSIKEHVTRTKHTDKLTVEETSTSFKKILLKEYVVDMTFVDVRHKLDGSETPHVLLNDTYFLNMHTFMSLCKFHNKIICQFCHIDLTPENVVMHVNSAQHMELMEGCQLITSLDNEFVRQVKTDLYHCGYCGCVEQDWDDMLAHLDTDAHNKCKHEHDAMLLDYKMSLIESHARNAAPFNILAMMRHMNMF